MEITTTTVTRDTARREALGALATFGIVVLLMLSLGLAVLSINRMAKLEDGGGAAAFLSGIFRSVDEDSSNKLEVVTATSTLPLGDEEPADPSAVSMEESDSNEGTRPNVSSGPARTTTVVRRVTTTIEPYGNPDLTVSITATGYCSSDKPSSFRKSNDINDDRNAGFQFTVKNIGTNVSGRWDFEYKLPTSATQRPVTNIRSLNPGDAVDYTLCFEKPRSGDDRTLSVEVDHDNDIKESNERNNKDSVLVDIDR